MESRCWYEGHRNFKGEPPEVLVRVEPTGESYPLHPTASQNLFNHSPTGFHWGYLGSGPAQLALALLLEATDDEELSLRHYQDFKFIVVANLEDNWYLSREGILNWLDGRESLILAEVSAGTRRGS